MNLDQLKNNASLENLKNSFNYSTVQGDQRKKKL